MLFSKLAKFQRCAPTQESLQNCRARLQTTTSCLTLQDFPSKVAKATDLKIAQTEDHRPVFKTNLGLCLPKLQHCKAANLPISTNIPQLQRKGAPRQRFLPPARVPTLKLTLPTHCPSKLPNWAPTASQELQNCSSNCSSVCQGYNTARLPKQPACNSCALRDLSSTAKLLACQSFNTASFPTHCPGQAAKLQARSSNKSFSTASKTAALHAKAPTLQGRVANFANLKRLLAQHQH